MTTPPDSRTQVRYNGAMTYRVIPTHIYGPSVITEGGSLVDSCPSVESAERIAAALAELDPAPLDWALPAVTALEPIECARVIRYLAKRLRARPCP